MSTIISTRDSSSKYDFCQNTYFHFNGAILTLHHWAGEGGDEDNSYMVDQWSIYHDNLEGVKDLHISWSVYESGHREVVNFTYPDGFDLKGLKDLLDDELGIEMPTSRK